jgi:large conductance mechanosensitive channel protein
MATKKPAQKTAAKAALEAKRAAAAAKASAAKAKASEATKGHANGFFDFVREQGVVGLAVGLAIGTAAGASVKTIVEQLISPLVGLITRGVELSSLKWVILPAKNGQAEVALGWGAVIASLITLLATALVVYLVIHGAKLDRVDKKKEAK